jgi:hypothetical protein
MFRVRSTGEVKSQGDIRKLHPNTSLPRVWDAATCDFLNVDPVLAAPQPAPSGEYKVVVRDGVTQDANGNWVEAYTERDMFADYTDEDGTVHTKAEQEQAYTALKDAEAAASVRAERDKLLAETDWMGMSDVTMSSEWATYRQALRDVPSQAGFPHNVTFPEKP